MTPALKPMVGTFRAINVCAPAFWQRRPFNRKAGRWVNRYIERGLERLLSSYGVQRMPSL